MVISTSQITGLILAGGRGQRVAEQDKGLLEYQGSSLIERQVLWFSAQLDQVIISANRNIEKYQSYNLPVYHDPLRTTKIDYSGPLTGVLTCLKYCRTQWLFVQPVDMPLMPKDLIEKLCIFINEQPIRKETNVYYLASSERHHYLSMLVSKKASPDLEKYLQLGEKKVKCFLESVGALAVDLGIDEKYFSNLNQLADYQ